MSPRFSSCSRTSENPRSHARSPANPGAPVGGMYGVALKGEPCVSAVLGAWNRVGGLLLSVGEDANGGIEGVVERGRVEGIKETRLEEMRERVACAGWVDASVGVDVEAEEAAASEVLDTEGDVVVDGGEAVPLRRGGSDREGLGATLTLPPRSTRMSFGLVISEASASARASSVDMGIGIWIGSGGKVEFEFDAADGWVLMKYKGSS